MREIVFPDIAIPTSWKDGPKRLATLALDLMDFISAVDDIIDDFLSSTNGGSEAIKLFWTEAATFIKLSLTLWIQPLSQIIQTIATSRTHEELKGAPAARFLDGFAVTFESVIAALVAHQDSILSNYVGGKGNTLYCPYRSTLVMRSLTKCSQLPIRSSQRSATTRTLPEILMQAVLVTRKQSPASNEVSIDTRLGELFFIFNSSRWIFRTLLRPSPDSARSRT